MVDKLSTHQDLVKTGLPRKGEDMPEEDQITQDLKTARKVKEKLVNRVKESISPVASESKGKLASLTSPLRGILSGDLAKKIIRILAIVILLILLLYIASLVAREIRKDGEAIVPGAPTPTLAPFLPYNPSIYAEDEHVLALEEEINVLDRELSTIQLKENILTPPVLDFNINFED